MERDANFQAGRFEVEEVKLFYTDSIGSALNLFHYAYTMVGIYDLFPDTKAFDLHRAPGLEGNLQN
jgi:hypothetical protein